MIEVSKRSKIVENPRKKDPRRWNIPKVKNPRKGKMTAMYLKMEIWLFTVALGRFKVFDNKPT